MQLFCKDKTENGSACSRSDRLRLYKKVAKRATFPGVRSLLGGPDYFMSTSGPVHSNSLPPPAIFVLDSRTVPIQSIRNRCLNNNNNNRQRNNHQTIRPIRPIIQHFTERNYVVLSIVPFCFTTLDQIQTHVKSDK